MTTSSPHTVAQCVAALQAGKVVLHPTDTLPGLTCDPNNPSAVRNLARIKGRSPDKPFIGLVPNWQLVELAFAPLPEVWKRVLAAMWPGPLSVVWQAATAMPKGLVASDGSLCLRCFDGDVAALQTWGAVINEMGYPLPSTSVNLAGEAARHTWEGACEFAETHGVFVPEFEMLPSFAAESSTVIAIGEGEDFQVLRPGMLDARALETALVEAP